MARGRGPGVALFLGLARWVMALPRVIGDDAYGSMPCTRFHFFGDTGHELQDYGALKTLQNLPALGLTNDTVSSWLHLGASITTFANFANKGAGEGSGVLRSTLQYSTSALGEAVTAPFAAAGYAPEHTDNTTGGELREIVDNGFAAWGFFGNFERFHTVFDDATSTSEELLGPVGTAVGQAMLNVIFNGSNLSKG